MLGVRNIRSLSHRVKLLDGRQVHLQEGGNLEAEKTLVFMPGSAFYIFPHIGIKNCPGEIFPIKKYLEN